MKRVSVGLIGMVAALYLVGGMAFAKDKKKDPEEIGNRDVGKGVNFYSLDRSKPPDEGIGQVPAPPRGHDRPTKPTSRGLRPSPKPPRLLQPVQGPDRGR